MVATRRRARGEKRHPYVELGQLLKTWRSARFRDVGSFVDSGRVSGLTVGRYASYERGEYLVEPALLIELAQVFHRDWAVAMLTWLRVQMPSDKHRERFPLDLLPGDRSLPGAAAINSEFARELSVSNTISLADLEKTWVFEEEDRRKFVARSWLFEFVVRLVNAYPQELDCEELELGSLQEFRGFCQSYLAAWRSEKRIIVSARGVRLSRPYIYIPKRDEWIEFRKQLARMRLEAVLTELSDDNLLKGVVLSETLVKELSVEQAKFVRLVLTSGVRQISAIAPERDPAIPKRSYVVNWGMSPTRLDLPAAVRRARKTRY